MVAGNGDEGDRGLALFSYLQVNGGFGGLFGGPSSGGIKSQADNLSQKVDTIAHAGTTPNGVTIDHLLSI